MFGLLASWVRHRWRKGAFAVHYEWAGRFPTDALQKCAIASSEVRDRELARGQRFAAQARGEGFPGTRIASFEEALGVAQAALERVQRDRPRDPRVGIEAGPCARHRQPE